MKHDTFASSPCRTQAAPARSASPPPPLHSPRRRRPCSGRSTACCAAPSPAPPAPTIPMMQMRQGRGGEGEAEAVRRLDHRDGVAGRAQRVVPGRRGAVNVVVRKYSWCGGLRASRATPHQSQTRLSRRVRVPFSSALRPQRTHVPGPPPAVHFGLGGRDGGRDHCRRRFCPRPCPVHRCLPRVGAWRAHTHTHTRTWQFFISHRG